MTSTTLTMLAPAYSTLAVVREGEWDATSLHFELEHGRASRGTERLSGHATVHRLTDRRDESRLRIEVRTAGGEGTIVKGSSRSAVSTTPRETHLVGASTR